MRTAGEPFKCPFVNLPERKRTQWALKLHVAQARGRCTCKGLRSVAHPGGGLFQPDIIPANSARHIHRQNRSSSSTTTRFAEATEIGGVLLIVISESRSLPSRTAKKIAQPLGKRPALKVSRHGLVRTSHGIGPLSRCLPDIQKRTGRQRNK